MFGRTKRLVGGGRRDQRCRLERQEGLAASGRMCLVGGGATMTAHMEQREVLAAGSNPALLDLKKAYSTSRLRVILQRLTTGEFLNHISGKPTYEDCVNIIARLQQVAPCDSLQLLVRFQA